jgi:hypothetical protein
LRREVCLLIDVFKLIFLNVTADEIAASNVNRKDHNYKILKRFTGMSRRKSFISFIFLTVFISTAGYSQGKFKAGLGFNYISNNYHFEFLDSYFAKSLHLSYAAFQQERFSLSLESASLLKAKEEDYARTTSFITSLPVNAQYEFRKIALHAGAGPAYLFQRVNYYQQKVQTSGASLHMLVGIAWKGEPIFADAVYPEFTIRINYLKSFKGYPYDAGMISFIIFLRGA